MTLSLKNAKDLDAPWTHWFLYGDSGSGKTMAASTFPNPVFIIPKNEGSITTLRGTDVPYYEATDMNSRLSKDGVGGMNAILQELEDEYHRAPDDFPFDTIVVESMSHYADLIIEELTEGGKAPMNQQQWGLLTAHIRNIQARLRNLDVHVVFTALAKTDKSDDGKTLIGEPLIQGQSARKLPAACDVIGYCEESGGKNNTVWRVHFRRHKHFAARSRFTELPRVVEDFHFNEVEQYITGPNNRSE